MNCCSIYNMTGTHIMAIANELLQYNMTGTHIMAIANELLQYNMTGTHNGSS